MASTDSYFDRIPAEWKATLVLSMTRPEMLVKKTDNPINKEDNLGLWYSADPLGVRDGNLLFDMSVYQYKNNSEDPFHRETLKEKRQYQMVMATCTPIAEYIKGVLMKDSNVLYVCMKKYFTGHESSLIVAVLPDAFSFIMVHAREDVSVSVYRYQYDRSVIDDFVRKGPHMDHLQGSWTIMQSNASSQHSRDNMSAFLGFTHPRLGKDSSANVLKDADLVRYEIYNQMVEPEQKCTEKEFVALLKSMCPPQQEEQQSPTVTRCMQCSGYILHGTGQ